MHFSVLGSLRIMDGSTEIAISAPRQRAILALLLVHANQVLSTDRIIDEVWGDDVPSSGVKTLQYHISKLRDTLGDNARLRTRSPGYVLEVDRTELDAFEFEDLAKAAAAHLDADPAAAAKTLGRALALWRGMPYSESAYEGFAAAETNRLVILHRTIVADRIDAVLQMGGHGEVIGQLESLVESHPYDERFRGQLMTALYRSGRQADALQEFQDARHLLGEELGIEPSSELAALEEQILLQAPELASPEKTASDFNLPHYVSTFVGRSRELEAVERLLETHRLVTLVGLGGIGKTRVGVEAATRRRDHHRHGVAMVDLSAVTEPDAVPDAFATSLGLRAEASVSVEDSITGYLSRRDTLLVVDNCEQVLEPAASLIHALLALAPSVTILATSVEPLGVPGEVTYRVPPLSVDQQGESDRVPDALALFIDRAQRRRDDLQIDQAFRQSALRICLRLDGIPLAIELAAARLRAMSIGDLEEGLSQRFAILTGGDRTALPRHQALVATLEWSYQLLDPDEQTLLRRLAVFRGGFDLAGVQTCCEGLTDRNALDVITRLCDMSMVLAGDGAHTRYRLLETIRDFASQKLADAEEEADARRRHALHYGRLVDRFTTEMAIGDRVAGFELLRPDESNVRAAVEWAIESGDSNLALSIAVGMGDYWFLNSDHDVARRTLGLALDTVEEPDSEALFDLLAHLSRFANWAGEAEEADEYIARQVALAEASGDRRALAQSLASQSAVAWSRGDYRQAREWLEEAIAELDGAPTLQVARWTSQVAALSCWVGEVEEARAWLLRLEGIRPHEPGETLDALIADCRGTILLQEGDLDGAGEQFAVARRLFESIGMKFSLLDMLQSEATILIEQGRYEDAGPVISRVLWTARELHDRRFGARGVLLQGRVAAETGEVETANQRLRAALRMSHAAGDKAGVLLAVLAMASLALRDEEWESALRLHGMAEAIRDDLGVALAASTTQRAQQELAAIRAAIGPQFDPVWRESFASGYPAALEVAEAGGATPSRSAISSS